MLAQFLKKPCSHVSWSTLPWGLFADIVLEHYQEQQGHLGTFGGNSGNERVAVGFYYSSTGFRTVIPLSPEMRATPTLAVTTDSQMHVEAIGGSASNSGHSLDQASPKAASINVTTSHSKTAGQAGQLMFNGSDNRLTLEAEL